jgi:hypothetical protein
MTCSIISHLKQASKRLGSDVTAHMLAPNPTCEFALSPSLAHKAPIPILPFLLIT